MKEEHFDLIQEHYLMGSQKIELFENYGRQAAITDFSILLGGTCDTGKFVNNTNSLKNRTGYYYTGSYGPIQGVTVIDGKGRSLRGTTFISVNSLGARPTCYHFDFAYHAAFLHQPIPKKYSNGIARIEYGEFPQSVVNEELSEKLNEELIYYLNYKITKSSQILNSFKIKETGKLYHFDNCYFSSKTFDSELLIEYEYNGRKYVRVRTNANIPSFTLSNGQPIEHPTICWIEVEPIVWLVDEKTNTIITEKIIFAGVPFNKRDKLKSKFKNNTIGQYMEERFSVDIIPGNGPSASKNHDYEGDYVKPEEPKAEDKKEFVDSREYSYNFDFSDVSDEEMIRGTIDSDIAVFLHGKSSDGKSARVKQIDPDCEIVYLRNATPDSLNGKSVYNEEKGEMIDVPPSWYKKIKEKCEREPDKLHIVFFDELTNALPSIQGMAFNIILDKEVNGVWKLPSNCRIVAAGNDMDDSLAANEMAEPLFNRFSHVYIETTVEKWLKWAAKKENNIHPAIYAYVAYKSCSRSDVLRTKYDGKKPNADPRKWEMASKVLYATKNPEMLRSLIGESLTNDFIAFCNHSVITLEDVIGGNYAEEDIKQMNISEKFATSIGLSKCEEKDLDVVRDFVSKLGAEVLATFDVLVGYKNDSQEVDKKQKNNRR